MTRAVLFDLDGTLADTAPDFHAAAAAMMRALGLPKPQANETRTYIGDGMTRFVKRVLTRQWWGEPEGALLKQAEALMAENYERECTARNVIYDGVFPALEELADSGFVFACVSNKAEHYCRLLLKSGGLSPFFPVVVGGDTCAQKKPSPQPILFACEQLGVLPKDALFVGDSISDSRAAEAAGCDFIVVSYGYHRNGDLPPAARVIDSMLELCNLQKEGNICVST